MKASLGILIQLNVPIKVSEISLIVFWLIILFFQQWNTFPLNFNLFRATSLFLYPVKRSENQSLSAVFWGYRKRPEAWNVLRFCLVKTCFAQEMCMEFQFAKCSVFDYRFKQFITDNHVVYIWLKHIWFTTDTKPVGFQKTVIQRKPIRFVETVM